MLDQVRSSPIDYLLVKFHIIDSGNFLGLCFLSTFYYEESQTYAKMEASILNHPALAKLQQSS